jgi:putative addiction module component (TIGR02574 family)
MTAEAQRILDAAMELDESDRAMLGAILLDSVGDGEPAGEIEAAWSAEIQRRLAAIESGEMELVSSEQVKLRMQEIIERAQSRQTDESDRLTPKPRRVTG